MDVRAKVLTYAVQSAIHTCNTFVCIMVHDFSAQYATHMCTDNIEITPVLRIRNTGVFQDSDTRLPVWGSVSGTVA